MKRILLVITFFSVMLMHHANAQENGTSAKSTQTSIGIVIYSNDVETVWNAMRLANYSKNQGDTVQIFLLAKGVEVDNLVKENSDLKEQVDTFLDNGGSIMGCGTCLSSRKNDEPEVCKFSSMKDLYELVRKNKIVLTF